MTPILCTSCSCPLFLDEAEAELCQWCSEEREAADDMDYAELGGEA